MRTTEAQIRANQLVIDCVENYEFTIVVEFFEATQLENELFDYYYNIAEQTILLHINEDVLNYHQDNFDDVVNCIDITLSDLIMSCKIIQSLQDNDASLDLLF